MDTSFQNKSTNRRYVHSKAITVIIIYSSVLSNYHLKLYICTSRPSVIVSLVLMKTIIETYTRKKCVLGLFYFCDLYTS